MIIPPEKIFIALDTPDVYQGIDYLNLFSGRKVGIKIGMELFFSAGPQFIFKAKEKGFTTFLDLKIHDIPTTVSRALNVLCKLPIDVINVHAAGGLEMLKLASATVKNSKPSVKLIAVTHLTSINTNQMNKELKIEGELVENVIHLSKMSKEAGLDGVVCSPFEVQKIKSLCGYDFLTVTPGIRGPNQDSDDQKRTATPKEAISFGSDYLVIGRPVTRSPDPLSALDEILNGRPKT